MKAIVLGMCISLMSAPISSMARPSLKWDDMGNGGRLVECQMTGLAPMYDLLDFFEARRQGWKIDIKASGASLSERRDSAIDQLLARVKAFSPHFASELRAYTTSMRFLTLSEDQELNAGEARIINGLLCREFYIAVQFCGRNHLGALNCRLTISRWALDRLYLSGSDASLILGGLIFHEALVRSRAARGLHGTEPIIKFVAMLASDRFQAVDKIAWREYMRELFER